MKFILALLLLASCSNDANVNKDGNIANYEVIRNGPYCCVATYKGGLWCERTTEECKL